MIAYLDTNVVLWLAGRDLDKITPLAQDTLRDSDLFISPMVPLELQYLYERGKLAASSRQILSKLAREIVVAVCPLPFSLVTDAALEESWTREPFDRLIVAQAKANGYARLITADRLIRANYPQALW